MCKFTIIHQYPHGKLLNLTFINLTESEESVLRIKTCLHTLARNQKKKSVEASHIFSLFLISRAKHGHILPIASC